MMSITEKKELTALSVRNCNRRNVSEKIHTHFLFIQQIFIWCDFDRASSL